MRIAWDRCRVRIRLVGRYRWADSGQVRWGGGVYDHLLWVVESGQGEVRTPRGRHRIATDSCVWYRPGVDFSVRQGRRPLVMVGIVFALKDAEGRDLGMTTDLPDDVLADPAPGFARAIADRLVALGSGPTGAGRNTFDEASRPAAEHLLTGLLMDLDRHNDRGPATAVPVLQPVQRAVYDLARAIAENPAAAPPPAEQARRIGISATHLCRLYRQLFRRSPGGFIITFRVRHAQRRLVETDDSLATIAEALGYASQAFFSRQFRERTGQSPSDFRRRNRS